MKITVDQLTPCPAGGTGRVGTCFLSRAEVEAVLGPPHLETAYNSKITHQWAFEMETDTGRVLFTIYDYNKTLPYSVGARGLRSLALARAVLGPKVRREMDAYYLSVPMRAAMGQPLTHVLDDMEAA